MARYRVQINFDRLRSNTLNGDGTRPTDKQLIAHLERLGFEQNDDGSFITDDASLKRLPVGEIDEVTEIG